MNQRFNTIFNASLIVMLLTLLASLGMTIRVHQIMTSAAACGRRAGKEKIMAELTRRELLRTGAPRQP